MPKISQLPLGTTLDPLAEVAVNNNGTTQRFKVSSLIGSSAWLALTDGPTITWDYTLGQRAHVTIAGNRTLVITGLTPGKTGVLKVKQDGTGSRTLTLTGNKPAGWALSTGANQVDVLGFMVDEAGQLFWTKENYGTVSSPDTTPPAVTSATVLNATTIRIVFSEVVTTSGVTGWSFKKNGSALTPSAVSGSGSNTLDFTVPTIVSGDVILRSYNSSTGDTVDTAANELVTFTDQAVTGLSGSLVDITYNNLSTVTQSGLRWTAGTNGAHANCTTIKLPASTDGYGQYKWVGTEPAGQYSVFALDETAGNSAFSSLIFGVHTVNGVMGMVDNGALVAPNGTGRTMVANDLIRIRRNGSSVVCEWSSDGGTTWTLAHTYSQTSTVLLYNNIWFNTAGGFIDSPKGFNFS